MNDIREAILESAGIELIPQHDGWVARIGMLDEEVHGRTAAEVLLLLADIVMGPETSGVQ